MNLDKLKPWNWFKHEDDEKNQVPVTKDQASGEQSAQQPLSYPAGSLLQWRNEVDRLFDDMWRSFGLSSWPSNTRNYAPLGTGLTHHSLLGDFRADLDIAADKNQYEVSIDVPGLSKNDIQVELTGNVLSISGKKEESHETKDKHYYRVERRVGSFQRKLTLPEDASLDVRDFSVSLDKGVLNMRIPRKALPKDEPKKIAISS